MRAGGKHSPETRAKLAAAGRNRSPEAVARSVALMHSPEACENRAATLRRPETQDKRAATMRANAAAAIGLNADEYDKYLRLKMEGYSKDEAAALARGEERALTRGVRVSGCVIDPRVRKLAHRRVYTGRTKTIGVVVLVAVILILAVL